MLQIIRSSSYRSVAVALAALGLFGGSACAPGSETGPSRAQQVFEQLADQDPAYAEFGFSLIGDYGEDAFAVRRIVEALESDNAGRERLALRALEQGAVPAEARAALEGIFTNRPGTLKLQAAIVLARSGDEAAAAWLLAQAQEQGDALSADAIRVLAERGELELVGPLLKRRTASDQLSIRNEAYAILGAIGQPWATQMLVEGLGHEFGEERAQAVTSLGITGDPAVAAHIEKLVGFQGLVRPSIEALGALGNPSSVKIVQRMAGHEQPIVRAYAGPALCRLGEAEACDAAVEPLIEDTDALVRRRLAEQLAAVDRAEAIDWLGRLTRDADADVRVEAVRSLLAAPAASGAQVAPLLVELTADPDYRVSTLALGGMARLGGSESLAAIEPLMESDNPYVALAAARAVGAIESRAN